MWSSFVSAAHSFGREPGPKVTTQSSMKFSLLICMYVISDPFPGIRIHVCKHVYFVTPPTPVTFVYVMSILIKVFILAHVAGRVPAVTVAKCIA